MTRTRIKIKQLENAQRQYLQKVKQYIVQSPLFNNKVEYVTVKPFDRNTTFKSWKYYQYDNKNLFFAFKGQQVQYYKFSYKWLALRVHFKNKQFDKLTDIRIKALDNIAWIYVNYKHPFDYITRDNVSVIQCPLDILGYELQETFNYVQENLIEFQRQEQQVQENNAKYIENRNVVIHNFFTLLKKNTSIRKNVLSNIQAFGLSIETMTHNLTLFAKYNDNVSEQQRQICNTLISNLIENENNYDYFWADDPYIFFDTFRIDYMQLRNGHWVDYNKYTLKKFRSHVDYYYPIDTVINSQYKLIKVSKHN